MTTQAPPTFDEVDYPYPPRFRWLKRLVVVYLLFGALLVGIRIWWGKLAQKRLDANIAAIRASGEPALAVDMNEEPVPDADNAAYYYRQAVAKLNPNVISPAASNYIYNDYPPFPRKWFALADASQKTNQGAFDLAREARKHPRVQWMAAYSSPLINVVLPHLNGARDLANHIGDNALLLHFTGNDAEAIESIKDVWALADAVDKTPLLVSHLVAIGIRALALDRLEIIARDLTIEGVSPTTRPTDRPATRQQVSEIMALVLDPDAEQRAVAHMFASERAFQVDSILFYPKSSRWMWPMFQLDAVAAMHASDQWIASTTQPTWPATVVAMRPTSLPADNLAHAFSRIVIPALNRARLTDFKVEAEARLAATILAVRLYRLDHNGAFPPNLDALVPKYLAKVPEDPFSTQPREIGYAPPGKMPHPMVYSVGEDYTDNTMPTPTTWPTEPASGWQQKDVDQWRDLTSWSPPPKPKPSTQNVNPGDESPETLDD